MTYRQESDGLGSVEVPAEAYYGAQTERSRQNFPIGDQRMPLEVIYALTYIKKAAAIVNGELGLLAPDKQHAIIEVSPVGRRLLRDTNAAAHEALVAANKPCKPEGWLRARVPIESIESAKRQFLRLGAEVKVVEPQALRAEIAEEARKVAAHYKR